MKKLFITVVVIIILLPVLFFTIRHVGGVPDSENTPALQLAYLLEDNGCKGCHTQNPPIPFYANLPGGSLVKKDIEIGLRAFDLANVLSALENNQPIPEVDLAKLEFVAEYKTMPLIQYQFTHWTSYLNSEELEVMKSALAQYRAAYNQKSLASGDFKLEPVRPIEDSIPVNVEKVKLGEKLYNDTRLSADNTVACATCHLLDKGGVDRLQYSVGVNNLKGGVNAPTVYNAVYNVLQFWDGRAKDLQEQAGGPPFNPVEMACKDWNEIIAKFAVDKAFTKEFTALYPNGFSGSSITEAIAEYEKTLLTPNSKFDKYLKGENTLAENELQGYALFKENKCATCHGGINMGGISFEHVGIHEDYLADRGNITQADSGRYNFTKLPQDIYKQKVPTLRNVAITPPYFHDGTVANLTDAVNKMMKYQVGKTLSDDETQKVVAFLNTLTGEFKGKLLQ